ncbi:hypothetical protein [Roseicyclus sp.]|uniref:hypothetical protein n=1 Tax=Roseicyclus sp. TaxID=1914329 RepID=UPI003F6D2A8B
MRRSLYASTAIHAALLIWVAVGDGLFKESPDPVFEVTGVTILSTAEFDALTAAATPVALEIAPPPPRPEPTPEPEPEPAPEPEPQPEPTPPGEVTDTLAPPAPLSGSPDLPEDGRPTPRAADRIAPLPTPAPEPEVETAPEAVTQSTAPAPSPSPVEAQPETAPEEATTEIVTEAETPSGGPLGPVASIRPPTRPERPRPAETPVAAAAPEPQPAPEPPPEPAVDPLAAAIASAVAQAVQAPAAPAGPPLSAGAREGFRVAVSTCWNVGSLSNEAQRTTVVVGFDMTPDARPVDGSLRLISFDGGSEAAARQAYEAARRAILRCGTSGYSLPAESYDDWRQVELVFNPEGMRLR